MTNKEKYKGVVIPAVTPLTKDLKLDYGALEKMLHHLHKHHVMPFINGTTGESTSLSFNLKKDFIVAALKLKQTDDVLYAGISANCLEDSVKLAKICFDNGVDAVAATLPSYYNLSDDQMLRYFENLIEQVPGPVIIYNIPVTTRMSIPLKIIDRLSYHEKVIGTKDSERSEERLKESHFLWAERDDFCHFLGWAPKSAEALINGSDGLIPSTGNLCPHIYDGLYKAVKNGDHERAYKFQKLSDAMGDVYQKGKLLGESLWALKVCMHELDLCDEYVMPPIYPLGDDERNKILKHFRHQVEKENLIMNSDANV
ncbi:dihydrodipicolinate synthase family protein [Mucilaginibacter sp.]